MCLCVQALCCSFSTACMYMWMGLMITYKIRSKRRIFLGILVMIFCSRSCYVIIIFDHPLLCLTYMYSMSKFCFCVYSARAGDVCIIAAAKPAADDDSMNKPHYRLILAARIVMRWSRTSGTERCRPINVNAQRLWYIYTYMLCVCVCVYWLNKHTHPQNTHKTRHIRRKRWRW